MRDLLNEAIHEFSARDFAGWLEGGIRTYLGETRLPSSMRMPDVFQYGELYIGRNQDDLAADIHDIYLDLSPRAQVAFKQALALIWSELEFKEQRTFALAETILVIACRVPAKNMVDVLAAALPWLAIAALRFDAPARKLRRRAFQAAVELATGNTGSILCLERFLRDQAVGNDVLQQGQALTIVRYLGLTAPQHLVYWCALFGDYIVADARRSEIESFHIRDQIIDAYGDEDFRRVVEFVRVDHVNRLATERYALTNKSMMGLYNLISLTDSPAVPLRQSGPLVALYSQPPQGSSRTNGRGPAASADPEEDNVILFKSEVRGRN